MKSLRLLLSWPVGLIAVLCGGMGLLFWSVATAAAWSCDKIAGVNHD